MPNRFKNREMRALYEAAMRAYNERHRALFTAHGRPHRGNGVADAFWRGFDAASLPWDRASHESAAYAYYRAGQDAGKAAGATTSARHHDGTRCM